MRKLMVGEYNYIELSELKNLDAEELLVTSLSDSKTTYWLVDKYENSTVGINFPFGFGFFLTFDDETVYLVPIAEVRNYRKFDPLLYKMEDLHSILIEESEKVNVKFFQYHNEPAIYFTKLEFSPFLFKDISSLETNLILALEGIKKLYNRSVLRAIKNCWSVG